MSARLRRQITLEMIKIKSLIFEVPQHGVTVVTQNSSDTTCLMTMIDTSGVTAGSTIELDLNLAKFATSFLMLKKHLSFRDRHSVTIL